MLRPRFHTITLRRGTRAYIFGLEGPDKSLKVRVALTLIKRNYTRAGLIFEAQVY